MGRLSKSWSALGGYQLVLDLMGLSVSYYRPNIHRLITEP